MAWGYGSPAPKPAKGESRTRRRTLRRTLGQKFRDAVWLRANGRCEVCGLEVIRTRDVLHPRAGHVAHNRGRNVAPADRFNPDAARLKCRTCHLTGDHAMRFA